MSSMCSLTEDLHPDIRDMEDLILEGYLDEFEAHEAFQDAEDARFAGFVGSTIAGDRAVATA